MCLWVVQCLVMYKSKLLALPNQNCRLNHVKRVVVVSTVETYRDIKFRLIIYYLLRNYYGISLWLTIDDYFPCIVFSTEHEVETVSHHGFLTLFTSIAPFTLL